METIDLIEETRDEIRHNEAEAETNYFRYAVGLDENALAKATASDLLVIDLRKKLAKLERKFDFENAPAPVTPRKRW